MGNNYRNLPIERTQEHELGTLVKYKGGPTVLQFNPVRGQGGRPQQDDAVSGLLREQMGGQRELSYDEVIDSVMRQKMFTDTIKAQQGSRSSDADYARQTEANTLDDEQEKYMHEAAEYLSQGHDYAKVAAWFHMNTGKDLSVFISPQNNPHLNIPEGGMF